MPKVIRSFATKDGRAFYKRPGRYYEIRQSAKKQTGILISHSPKQQFLASKIGEGAACLILPKLKAQLGL